MSAAQSPPADQDTAALTIARLEARVAGLEAALARRSHELQRIQRELPARDLVALSRLLAGLPPSSALSHDPVHWDETTELTTAEVEEVLTGLWRSLGAAAGAGDPPP